MKFKGTFDDGGLISTVNSGTTTIDGCLFYGNTAHI